MQRPFTAFACLAVLAALGAIAPAGADTTPSPAPTASASPSPVPETYLHFIEADVLPGERVANAATPDLTGRITNRLRAAAEYKFLGRNFLEFELPSMGCRPSRRLRHPAAHADAGIRAGRAL